MVEQEFTGTWHLISQIVQRSDGSTRYPRGENAIGILMYDAYGNMSVQLMRREMLPGNPTQASPLPADWNLSDPALAFQYAMDHYLAYFGTYRVDRKHAAIIHFVKGSSYAGYIGTQQKRRFCFDANRLTLMADTTNANNEAETRILTWRRAG